MKREHRFGIFQVKALMKRHIFNVCLAQTMFPNRITQLLLNRLVVGPSPEIWDAEEYFPALRKSEKRLSFGCSLEGEGGNVINQITIIINYYYN